MSIVKLITETDLTNAKLGSFNHHIPVMNIKEVPDSPGIFRADPIPPANIIPPPGMTLNIEKASDLEVFFTRDYDIENNELDQAFHEYEVGDLEILGVSFTMIPKHKLLFSYEKSSIIAKPYVGMDTSRKQ